MTAPAAPVFLPSERVEPGADQVHLVLREVAEGVLVLPAYSTLEQLVRCCGPDQPWIALGAADVDATAAGLGVAAVLLDTAFSSPTAEPASEPGAQEQP